MAKIVLAVSEEVHEAAKYMAKSLGVTLASLGDGLFTVYGKHEAEIAAQSLRVLDHVEPIDPESRKEAESMKKRLKASMEPYIKLAEIFDLEEERINQIIDDALEKCEGNVLLIESPKKGGKK